jgi:hypothetical protein
MSLSGLMQILSHGSNPLGQPPSPITKLSGGRVSGVQRKSGIASPNGTSSRPPSVASLTHLCVAGSQAVPPPHGSVAEQGRPSYPSSSALHPAQATTNRPEQASHLRTETLLGYSSMVWATVEGSKRENEHDI